MSTQHRLDFIQTGHTPPNNRKIVKSGEDGASKAEAVKQSDKKGGEASSGGKKKTFYHCGSDEHLLIKCP